MNNLKMLSLLSVGVLSTGFFLSQFNPQDVGRNPASTYPAIAQANPAPEVQTYNTYPAAASYVKPASIAVAKEVEVQEQQRVVRQRPTSTYPAIAGAYEAQTQEHVYNTYPAVASYVPTTPEKTEQVEIPVEEPRDEPIEVVVEEVEKEEQEEVEVVVENKDDQIQELKNKRDILVHEKQELQKQYDQERMIGDNHAKTARSLATELDNADNTITRLREDLDVKEKEAKRIINELKLVEEDASYKIEALKKENIQDKVKSELIIEELRILAEDALNERAQLEDKVKKEKVKTEKVIEELRLLAQDSLNETVELNEKLEKAKKENERVSCLQKENDDLQAKLEELIAENQKVVERVAELEQSEEEVVAESNVETEVISSDEEPSQLAYLLAKMAMQQQNPAMMMPQMQMPMQQQPNLYSNITPLQGGDVFQSNMMQQMMLMQMQMQMMNQMNMYNQPQNSFGWRDMYQRPQLIRTYTTFEETYGINPNLGLGVGYQQHNLGVGGYPGVGSYGGFAATSPMVDRYPSNSPRQPITPQGFNFTK